MQIELGQTPEETVLQIFLVVGYAVGRSHWSARVVGICRNAKQSDAEGSGLRAELICEAGGTSVVPVDQDCEVHSLNRKWFRSTQAFFNREAANKCREQARITHKRTRLANEVDQYLKYENMNIFILYLPDI